MSSTGDSDICGDPDELINNSYHAYLETDVAVSGDPWYLITFEETITPKTVFVNNEATLVNDSMGIAGAYICTSNDNTRPATHSANCSPAIFDTGFIKVDLPAGKFLWLQKVNDGNSLIIKEVRVYQMYNLLESAISVITPHDVDTMYDTDKD